MSAANSLAGLSGWTRELDSALGRVPDFPHAGICFYDIGPVLRDKDLFSGVISRLVDSFAGEGITRVVGVESRGFILAAPVALALQAGFVPLRKAGKLPGPTRSMAYDLEYGNDTLEVQVDSLAAGERVLVIDDVLATGGTAGTACRLVQATGATLVGIGFLLELLSLNGRAHLPAGVRTVSLLGIAS